jgi:uncharacterized protein YndB with AHSA1/START domain
MRVRRFWGTRNRRVAYWHEEASGVRVPDRVVREVVLPARRDEVWDALTRPERLVEWFGGPVDIEPVPRGRVEHRTYDGSRRTGFVLSADRPFRLTFWWAPDDDDGEGTRVEFVLLEHADGTSLTVTESPAPNPAFGGGGPVPALASA